MSDCATLWTAAHQAPLSMEFSRQEYWSGLSFPSLLLLSHFSRVRLCVTLQTGFPIPGILQARTLEWVAHFLLQCMKVKSESEVAQWCPTVSDPVDCSLPGSSAHGIFQARVLEWVAIAFSNC